MIKALYFLIAGTAISGGMTLFASGPADTAHAAAPCVDPSGNARVDVAPTAEEGDTPCAVDKGDALALTAH